MLSLLHAAFDCRHDIHRNLRDNAVSESLDSLSSMSVHPGGNPMNHSAKLLDSL